MNEKLNKKFNFLKMVKMPRQTEIIKNLIEYKNYDGVKENTGKYGHFVLYHNEDLVQQCKNLRNYGKEIQTLQEKELNNKIESLNNHGADIKRETGDFRHVYINDDKRDKTECRLYLRIMPLYIRKLVKELITKCVKNNLPIHFKYSINSSRIDSIIIYTNYDNSQKIVDIINEIYNENPKYFKNSDKLHPMWGNINGYIGFMEEPIKDVLDSSETIIDKSANVYRSYLFDKIANYFKNSHQEPTLLTRSFLKTFSEDLDIDSTYLPLNASSVKELNDNHFNVAEIGTKFKQIYQTYENDKE